MKRKIIYLHGFKSSSVPCGVKIFKLEKMFPDDEIIPVKYNPHKPKQTKKLLKDIIDKDYISLVVGTSLGGWWSLYCSKVFGVKAVALNPTVEPYNTLSVGEYKTFNNHTINITNADISGFKTAWNELLNGKHIMDALVLIANDDDIIDPKRTKELLKGIAYNIVDVDGGGHRFTKLSEKSIVENITTWIDVFFI